jgi:hypothetical protein
MENSPMSNFSFHAQVAPEAIDKVGRLFNASIDDILGELLQNARRAGASRVSIDQIEDPRFGQAIRIADNGAGIADPRSFFSLGHSDWPEALSRSEDAAGMGFFALANRGATIVARQKAGLHSWAIAATPKAFQGKEPVRVDAGPNGHEGVTIVFPERKEDNLADAARRAARFFPVPVLLNGEAMRSSDFLDTADHIEEWRGIRIGVFARDPSRHDNDNANFHGVTLKIPLPELRQSWHRTCCARIDVVDCAHLKLVLPARKDVVRDAMYEALVEEIDRVYFRMIAADGPHSLSFEDYQRGRQLGIELKEAEPRLRPHAPAIAEAGRNILINPIEVPDDAFVFDGDGPLQEQNLARAIAGLKDAPMVFEPNPGYAGYRWYDELRRFRIKSHRMEIDGSIEEINPDDIFDRQGRPDRLEIVLEIFNADEPNWVLKTDLIISGPDYGSLDQVEIHVTRQSAITPAELKAFLVDALFSPSDDVDAGSYDQQEQWFSDEAEDMSIALLQSPQSAELNAVVRIVERELVWRVPKEGSFVIRIHNQKVSVEGWISGADAGPPASPETISSG